MWSTWIRRGCASRRINAGFAETGLRVALVGRPNVGKSTLFNRLTGNYEKRTRGPVSGRSMVDATPGVTRDVLVGRAALSDLRFDVLDTAGLEGVPLEVERQKDGPLSSERRVWQHCSVAALAALDENEVYRRLYDVMADNTLRALRESDVVLLVIDASSGVTPLDTVISRGIRKLVNQIHDRVPPVLVVANKCDKRRCESGIYEAYALGWGTPAAISAATGSGLANLYDTLTEVLLSRDREAPLLGQQRRIEPPAEQHDTIPIAVVGRPNVGKSSFVNAMVGRTIAITGPAPGVTRDPVAAEFRYGPQTFRIVDTAGMRRRGAVESVLERASVEGSLRAIRHSHVVLLLIDAQEGLTSQDIRLGNLAIEQGRPVILVVNKWDLISAEQKSAVRSDVARRADESLGAARGAALFHLSAIDRSSVATKFGALARSISEVHARWSRTHQTSHLSQWLRDFAARQPPPALTGGPAPKLQMMTQSRTRPPTFMVFGTWETTAAYTRALTNRLRSDLDLPGVPVRVRFRGPTRSRPGHTR